MSLMTSLFTYATTDVAIAALIGTQMYPQIAQGATLPYTTYFRSSRDREPMSSGPNTKVTTSVVMVHYAETYPEAAAVAEAFRVRLNGKQRATVGDQYFSVCHLLGETDTLEPLEFAQNDAPHFVRQIYEITHQESI